MLPKRSPAAVSRSSCRSTTTTTTKGKDIRPARSGQEATASWPPSLVCQNSSMLKRCICCAAAWLLCTALGTIPTNAHDLPLDRIMNGFVKILVLAATGVGIGGWSPPTDAQDYFFHHPRFVVDPRWPKPPPAPVGTDGVAHTWIQGEVAGACVDRNDNVYTYNRAWEVGAPTIIDVIAGTGTAVIHDSFDTGAQPRHINHATLFWPRAPPLIVRLIELPQNNDA